MNKSSHNFAHVTAAHFCMILIMRAWDGTHFTVSILMNKLVTPTENKSNLV